MTLDGKAALVTGGSRGIGEAVAIRLAEEGADVALTYHSQGERAADVVDRIKGLGRRAWAVQADGVDAQAVRAAVEGAAAEFGRLDILVNNAGVGALGPIAELSLDDVDRVLAVNVRAPFLLAQAATAHMADGGRIINIGSCMAERVAFPGGSLYATSKTALTGLTKALARELGPRGITANLIHPGPVDTDMNPADGENAAFQSGFTALGRYGRTTEIAATVAHLAGDSGRYITGASIAVDGGFAV
ncbi:SDR family NAD(P)-dependent oxidoreductase [Streptomyces rapamycinicus]|uniref:3-ketoacyl-ACP reductase n=2 Tax=Streptomyces rapamycinicus TaxID=1226757 RepID=A0A0A0NMF3_STRRN|nr:3-oxoacyl-ACP reductase family protein [Streptomyces rapamycinicus]AGP55550.1 3-ketoacyl-ACP reductase [Streptomyces rapamycinicus NRRL 5491]MBB4783111.1 NAD(P)-dependent dehydrogenase (short-subunit alcohol dehydrogenase family) [Streptomyces rapamycinicus]RLV81415.1 3-ketoacyl-ACP reductase [Streptomyces rapamycinicus NRRL 5491]UTO63550.1 3-oxoacyl-ACP reductase FabG [Streptomyces rapamycinicus]UTP31506.1 3-oxoacyl-ACP reductase FabG [Streptomyces rapamycinicus NRRL 5491]